MTDKNAIRISLLLLSVLKSRARSSVRHPHVDFGNFYPIKSLLSYTFIQPSFCFGTKLTHSLHGEVMLGIISLERRERICCIDRRVEFVYFFEPSRTIVILQRSLPLRTTSSNVHTNVFGSISYTLAVSNQPPNNAEPNCRRQL